MRIKLAMALRSLADRLDPTALMAEGYAEQADEAACHPGIYWVSTSGNCTSATTYTFPPITNQ